METTNGKKETRVFSYPRFPYRVLLLFLFYLQVGNFALEVTCLFQWEDKGADIAHSALSFLVHPAFLNVQFLHLLTIDEQTGTG